MLVNKGSRGRRLSPGHPEANERGYASDDPGDPAEYRCDWCKVCFTEDEEGACPDHPVLELDLCPECAELQARKETDEDVPLAPGWLVSGIMIIYLFAIAAGIWLWGKLEGAW